MLLRASILSWSSRCCRPQASAVMATRSTSRFSTQTMFSKVAVLRSRASHLCSSSAALEGPRPGPPPSQDPSLWPRKGWPPPGEGLASRKTPSSRPRCSRSRCASCSCCFSLSTCRGKRPRSALPWGPQARAGTKPEAGQTEPEGQKVLPPFTVSEKTSKIPRPSVSSHQGTTAPEGPHQTWCWGLARAEGWCARLPEARPSAPRLCTPGPRAQNQLGREGPADRAAQELACT